MVLPLSISSRGPMPPAAQPTCFLIADISGYTGYLADVELDHAQDILADLIGAVVTALRPDFRLAKLEGDAAFTFMTTEAIDGWTWRAVADFGSTLASKPVNVRRRAGSASRSSTAVAAIATRPGRRMTPRESRYQKPY